MNGRAILRIVGIVALLVGTGTAQGGPAFAVDPSPSPPTDPTAIASSIPPTSDPPTDTPTPTPTDTPTPTPTDTPTPTPAPSPTPTPTTTAPPPTTTAPGPTTPPAPATSGATTQRPRSSSPVAMRPHPHRTPAGAAPQRPHPHKTLGPVLPRRDHPHRKPWPITLTLNTVPALPGVHFTFDGHLLVTAANGRATYTAEHDFVPHTLTLTDTSLQVTDHRYQFSRWAGQRNPNQAFTHTVTALPFRQSYAITAAFTVQQQVTPRFVEENGSSLDRSRISAITVKSDTGQLVRLSPTGAAWLDGMRPAYHHSALTADPAIYSLQSVMVSGTNVVDAGRQTFKPASNITPTFITQFYDLVITGHDALFKTAMGKQAIVTFPDGNKQTVTLNAQHTATLPNLPRGTYTVRLKVGNGIVAADQFALSKDKTVDVAVISLVDIAVLIAAALIAALALIAIGRHWWRYRPVRKLRRLLRRDSSFVEQPEDVLS